LLGTRKLPIHLPGNAKKIHVNNNGASGAKEVRREAGGAKRSGLSQLAPPAWSACFFLVLPYLKIKFCDQFE
jgi:hypothetical protein